MIKTILVNLALVAILVWGAVEYIKYKKSERKHSNNV